MLRNLRGGFERAGCKMLNLHLPQWWNVPSPPPLVKCASRLKAHGGSRFRATAEVFENLGYGHSAAMLPRSQGECVSKPLDSFSAVTGDDITLSDMSLAKRIRASRLTAGLSQSELARRIKRNASAVNHMESGRSKALKSETVLALASALSVSAYWLETGIGSPTADARLSPEEAELVSLYRSMNATTRDAWLSVGRTLRDAQAGNKAGPSNPYPTKPKRNA